MKRARLSSPTTADRGSTSQPVLRLTRQPTPPPRPHPCRSLPADEIQGWQGQRLLQWLCSEIQQRTPPPWSKSGLPNHARADEAKVLQQIRRWRSYYGSTRLPACVKRNANRETRDRMIQHAMKKMTSLSVLDFDMRESES